MNGLKFRPNNLYLSIIMNKQFILEIKESKIAKAALKVEIKYAKLNQNW